MSSRYTPSGGLEFGSRVALPAGWNFPAPYVAANLVRTSPATRFQFRGVQVHAISIQTTTTEQSYANALYGNINGVCAAVKAAGGNLIRVFTSGANYVSNQWESGAAYVNRIASLVAAANAHGLYVMLSDNAVAGQPNTVISGGTYTSYFPFVDALCARFNSNPAVFYELWNEPADNPTRAQWLTLHTDTIDRYRAHGYTGLLVANGENYGAVYDTTAMDTIVAHDTNTAFSMHHYVQFNTAVGGETFLGNSYTQSFEQTFAVGCATYPLLMSEMGPFNSDFNDGGSNPSFPLVPVQMAQRFAGLYQRGWNGGVAFEWSWFDPGTMTGTGDGLVKDGSQALSAGWGVPIVAALLQTPWGINYAPGQTQFTAATPSTSGVALAWYSVVDATGYVVTRDGSTIYTGTGTSYAADPGDTSNHNYVVTATNATGSGPASPTVTTAKLPLVASKTLVQEVAKGTATATTTTPTLTVGAGVTTTVGRHLLMRLGLAASPTSVTDSKGNTWAIDFVYFRNQYTGFASAKITTPLVTGDTIVIHTATSNAIHCAVVEEWSGLAASSWFGGHDAGTFNNSTARGTLGVTVPANGLVFGTWSTQTASETVTPGAGFALAHSPFVSFTGIAYSLESVQALDSGSGGSYTPSATGINVHSEGCGAYYV